MLVAGVDPGIRGAVVIYDMETQRVVSSILMPTLELAKAKGTKHWISLPTLRSLLSGFHPRYAFVENVASSPQMGVTSAFSFGRSFGGAEGVIAGLGWPYELVAPQRWKKALAVPKDKDDARNRACQLLPHDIHHWTPKRGELTSEQAGGVAEAALIAVYGAIWFAEHFPGVGEQIMEKPSGPVIYTVEKGDNVFPSFKKRIRAV
jgi:crossover junction endodeoxyribonuclease RuvC